MLEITTTRHNEMIEPFLHIWRWEIPVYLFLGGLVAGIMIILGYFLWTGRYRKAESSAALLPVLAIGLLSLGMFALFLDLENKLNVWRMYVTFEPTSPMSWGAWILVLVYPALVLAFLLRPHEGLAKRVPALFAIAKRLDGIKDAARYVGAANIGLGVMLGAYTGVLLSSLGARPLWNTSVLWLLFLVSGLSSGAALVHLISKERWEKEILAKTDNGLLAFELVIIAMMIVGLSTTSAAHKEAVSLVLTGPFASPFWVFVVGLGIVVPLILGLQAGRHRIAHTAIGPLLVIVGGLALRFVLVYAGQQSHYFNAHFL